VIDLRYRILPSAGTPRYCRLLLHYCQKSILNLHVSSYYHGWRGSGLTQNITSGYDLTSRDETRALSSFLQKNPVLKSLALVFRPDWPPSVHDYWFPEGVKRPTHEATLQMFKMYGRIPSTFISSVLVALDLSLLTNLTLLRSDFLLIEALETVVRRLTNLHIDIGVTLRRRHYKVLQRLLWFIQDLRHVYLNIPGSSMFGTYPPTVVNPQESGLLLTLTNRFYLWPLRDKIRSLSVNDANILNEENVLPRHGYASSYTRSRLSEFRDLCSNFVHLQQLGWHMFGPCTELEALNLLVSPMHAAIYLDLATNSCRIP
jgi:hypothetical protein